MGQLFRELLGSIVMPHRWQLTEPSLIWVEAIADTAMGSAYLAIAFMLVRFALLKRSRMFTTLYLIFACFIFCCGIVELLEVLTFWKPVYEVGAAVKVLTALVSVIAAILIVPALPRIRKTPSPDQWRLSNEHLQNELVEHESAEERLREANRAWEVRSRQENEELEQKRSELQTLTAAWDLSHGMVRDLDGTISFWCLGSEELYGWNKAEAQGQRSHALLETIFPKPLAEIDAELEEKGSWSGELIHRTKTGEELHVATYWILQKSDSGSKISVIEVNNDISHRRRAEEASRRLADLVESSNDAIISTGLNGIVTSWNIAAEEMFEYTAAEMEGQPMNKLVPVSERELEKSFFQTGLVSTSAKPREVKRITKSGRIIFVSLSLSAIRNSAGDIIGTSQILRDISAIKEQQEAFRLSEERQRLAVEAGQIGLWYLNTADNSIVWTQRCKELHGMAADSEIPDFPGPLALIHPDDRLQVETAIRQAIEQRENLSVEYRTRDRDARMRWIQTKGKPQLDSFGQVRGIHGAVIDLTERREMEDKLRRANTELEQFAYAAAHDLQEPLRNVALAADLLKTKESRPALVPSPVLLDSLRQNALRMERMVKDLLAYSRVIDVMGDGPKSCDAAVALEKVLHELSTTIEEKQAQIKSQPLPKVGMEETHLIQVLQNLIGNSLKYTGPERPVIDIGVETRGGDFVFAIKDNGIGIAPEFHSRAFGMFKRLNTNQAAGSGIGLTLSKRIVEHYGGKIWVDSQVEQGATFFFTVPSAK